MAKIERYDFSTLTNFRKIHESKGELDLVNVVQRRRINLDPDCKRKLVRRPDGSISPYTVPHRDINEMLRHRSAMERIRKRGVEALPELILRQAASDEARLRRRGGDEVTIARQFLRGMFQKRFAAAGVAMSHREMAAVLRDLWQQQNLVAVAPRVWTRTHVKNETRDALIWAPGCFMPTPRQERLVDGLCQGFEADRELVGRLLFSPAEHEQYSTALIEQITLAVLFAPATGISPFAELNEMGFLPGLEKLKTRFSCLTPLMMKRLAPERFQPGALPSSDSERLTFLFLQLDVPWRYCAPCARVIAPPATPKPGRRHNPSAALCMDAFAQALFQPQIRAKRVKVGVLIDRLQRFGITRSRLYLLRKTKFHPNTINDTRENRALIQRLARSLGTDPVPFLAALLAPTGAISQ